MTEEQQKELAQIFEAMGNAKGNFVIGQVMGTQINYFREKQKESTHTEQTDASQDNDTASTNSRSVILDQLLALADKGEWAKGITADDIKIMLKQVLGKDETTLDDKEAELSEALWRLLERGRGDRVKIVWQNLLGYFIDKRLLSQAIGAPTLNKMFFGDDKGYTNIDKGRPSKGLMSADFESLLPLLDSYLPKK